MARAFRNAGLWSVGLLGVVAVGPLAILSPIGAALVVGAGGFVLACLAQIRLSGVKRQCEKISQEMDLLSGRLLKAEQAEPTSVEPRDPADLRAEVHELTVEIGLLSGIVRDLSAVVRSQDSAIEELRAKASAVDRSSGPPPAAVSQPAPPPPQRVIPPAEPQPRSTPRPIPPRPQTPPPGPADADLVAAFDAGQLDVLLQPVVTLPQRKVVAYQALPRLRVEDRGIEAGTFLPALERHGRTTELDRRMLARAGTVVRHLGGRGSHARVAYGLSPLSLFEPDFLKEIARMAADDQSLAALDLTLPQASWRGLDSGQLGLLAALRGRVGLGLDRPSDLRFEAQDLAGHGIGEVRVPARMLLHPASGPSALNDISVEDLAPALARTRIRLVATEVAGEADVPDLIDLNVPFAQGEAFAPARPVRGEILTAALRESPSPPEDDPGPERRPFRSFLRRAG